MTLESAALLIAYTIDNSSRFVASSVEFFGETWVIFRDVTAHRSASCIEPILHVDQYLAQENPAKPLDSEFRKLLTAWCQLEARAITRKAEE